MSDGDLSGGDPPIVRPAAVQVGPGVGEPGEVDRENVPREDAAEEALVQRLVPEVPGNQRGQEAPDEEDHRGVPPPLEHHNRVRLQVVQADRLAAPPYLGVLLHQKPALKEGDTKMIKF